MAFSRPSLNQLIERINTDLASRVVGRAALLRRATLRVLARVLAGASHMLHGHLDYNARQILPDTADSEHLRRHASLYDKKPTAAQYAGGGVVFAGTDGRTVPAGTILQTDNGAEYTVDADAEIVDGEASPHVIASAAGAAGNIDAGVTLSLLSPIPGVDSSATVGPDSITGGADAESDERLLERLLLRMQKPPQGGAKPDYVQWAIDQPQVTRAWAYPRWMGAGTVGVTFVCDDLEDIIPNDDKVDEVQSAIDELRPVTAEVFAFAATKAPLEPVFAELSPNTQAVRDAIRAELADLVKREATPGGTILLTHIREAISVAAGETDHRLDWPTDDVTHAANEMPVMGGITWP